MMVADTVIAGRYGTEDLAGVAIGSSYYISVVMLLTGTLQAISPTIAHHVGAGRQEAIAPALQQGFWLALLLAGPGIALLLNPGFLLEAASVPPAVAAKATDYLAATAFGLPALLLYRSFYAFNNAVGRPRVLMAISAITMFTHIPLAWALTNGALGFAAMGGTGCGVSTATVHWHRARLRPRLPDLQPRVQALPPLPRLAGAAPAGARPAAAARPADGGVDLHRHQLLHPDRHPRRPPRHRDGGRTPRHRQLHRHDLHAAAVAVDRHHGAGGAVGRRAGLAPRAPHRAAGDEPRARLLAAGGRAAVGAARAAGGLLDPPTRRCRRSRSGWSCGCCSISASTPCRPSPPTPCAATRSRCCRCWCTALCFWGIGLAGGYWLSFHAPWRAEAPTVAGFWEACVLATLAATLLFGALLRCGLPPPRARSGRVGAPQGANAAVVPHRPGRSKNGRIRGLRRSYTDPVSAAVHFADPVSAALDVGAPQGANAAVVRIGQVDRRTAEFAACAAPTRTAVSSGPISRTRKRGA